MKGELPGATGRLISLEVIWDGIEDRSQYPFSIPALAGVGEISFDQPVTFLVGENGSGKSTVLEAVAVAAGFNAEGGSRNLSLVTRSSHSQLHQHLVLAWRGTPRRGFFLRAESFYGVASEYERLPGSPLPSYHAISHGEAFLKVVEGHFLGRGLYLMDEPESALSVLGQLQLLLHMDRITAAGGQFVIASHSPILTAFPGATVYQLADGGISEIEYTDSETYRLTKSFLDNPEGVLRTLLATPK
ncbi:MAG: AAA family ATPase [Candidatus Dormibacteria bacterium]